MVPDFNDEGVLPEGEYDMSIGEFKAKFVYNNVRAAIFVGLLALIEDLRAIRCTTIYVDGSFVTDKDEPGDVDVCWEDTDDIDWDLLDAEYQILFDMEPPRDWQQYKYSADVFPANLPEGGSGKLFKDFFKTNKETDNPKGIIKINI